MGIIDAEKHIITDSERDERRVARLSDRPNNNSTYGKAGMSPQDVKKTFDEAVDLVVKRYNAFVEAATELISDHEERIGNPNDTGVGDENVYQVLRLVKSLLGSPDDNETTESMYGKLKMFEIYLGSEDDAPGTNSFYGQKKEIQELIETFGTVVVSEEQPDVDTAHVWINPSADDEVLILEDGDLAAIDTALGEIIEIQNSLIGGDGE